MNYLLGIVLLILLITGVVEHLLSATWSKFYFSTGIPIVTRILPVDLHHANIPSTFVFEKKFKSNWFDFTGSLVFHQLDNYRYGFRESLLRGKRSFMHGLLIFDYENHQIIVKGFLNWTTPFVVFLMVCVLAIQWIYSIGAKFEPTWVVALAGFGVLGIIVAVMIWVDYVRVSAVAQFAAQSWPRQYIHATSGG